MIKERKHKHIERVLDVVCRGDDNAMPTGPDDIIRRSWVRCANRHGLDPSRPRTAQILPSRQLKDHQERIDEFLSVARAGMEQLYKQMAPLGYVLLLADADGVTVDSILTPGHEKELKAAGVYKGACWKEEHAGTSGLGTAIAERTPLIVHQEDHFDSTHISLSCIASPIFDPRGDLLAILNITAMMAPREKHSQFLTLQLTCMQAQAIEDANFIRTFGNDWIMRLGRAWPFAEVSGELMLAFDDEGVILGANTAARRELTKLTLPADWLIGLRLTDVFQCQMEAIWKSARGASVDASLLTKDSQNLFYIALRLPRRPRDTRLSLQTLPSSTAVQTGSHPALDSLAGEDAAMQRAIGQAKRLLNRHLNILIHGETGSGKELFARALYKSSERANQPFVALNCAAIPESLIESELFGHAPGSFTGARVKGAKGLIQQSDGGTLFLDEIGDMPLHLQTRLLRVLSENEVMPIGGDKPVRVNLSVIAASHRDLRTMIAAGNFREDLYYRLGGATLNLPPLRERSDIRFIIDSILRQETASLDFQPEITSEALNALVRYQWPGNVRELRNSLRYALALSEDGEIHFRHLPHQICFPNSASAVSQHSHTAGFLQSPPSNLSGDAEREELLAALRKHKWNITAVASAMDVSRVTIYRHMKRLKIVSPTESQ